MAHAKRTPLVRLGFLTAFERASDIEELQRAEYSILSLTTSKSIGDAAGTFNITLLPVNLTRFRSQRPQVGKYQALWYEALRPMDMVTIELYDQEAGDYRYVMTGLLDRVKKTVSLVNGRPTRTVTLAGRDLGKLLLVNSLVYLPQFDVTQFPEAPETLKNSVFGVRTRLISELAGADDRLGSVILALFNPDFGIRSTEIRLSDDTDIWEHLIVAQEPTGRLDSAIFERANYIVPDFETIGSYSGPIWNLLDQLIDQPFLEMFVDTDPETGDGYLWVRETPFDMDAWDALPECVIEADSLLSDLLERNDLATSTIYTVEPANFYTEDIYLAIRPRFNSMLIKRFGLRWYRQATQLLRMKKDHSNYDFLIAQAESYARKVYEWFKLDPWFERGSLEVRGTVTPRIGQRLRIEPQGKEFYVVQVAHRWQVGQPHITTVSLDRGMNTDLRRELLAEYPDEFLRQKEALQALKRLEKRQLEAELTAGAG